MGLYKMLIPAIILFKPSDQSDLQANDHSQANLRLPPKASKHDPVVLTKKSSYALGLSGSNEESVQSRRADLNQGYSSGQSAS
jgi:hypothetical protein